MLWGNLRRSEPFSPNFGFSRGTPMDRYYLDQFLEGQREAVVGVVGEVGEANYARRFAGAELRRIEVIDRDPRDGTTVVADIGVSGSLPAASFDCLIVTQVLQYVPDVGEALRNLIQALRPGGTLLVAVPALTPRDVREPLAGDYWRFAPAGMAHLVHAAAPWMPNSVVAYGNLLSATAFLHGLAAEELSRSELARQDDRFPILVCARVDVPLIAEPS